MGQRRLLVEGQGQLVELRRLLEQELRGLLGRPGRLEVKEGPHRRGRLRPQGVALQRLLQGRAEGQGQGQGQGQGGEGVGAGHEARPPGEGRQDPHHRGHLPPLAAHQGVPDHRPVLPARRAQGRGDEDPPRAEDDVRRPAQPVRLLRARRRLRRSHRPRSQVREGGCHGHPRRHHRGQDAAHPRPPRVLGEQARPAPHGADEGGRQERLRARPPRPGPARRRRRRLAGRQEDARVRGRRRLLHVLVRPHALEGQLHEGHLRGPQGHLRLPHPGPLEADHVREASLPGVHGLPRQHQGLPLLRGRRASPRSSHPT
mmetsp:Transcript_53166/g.156608  ORF Transcript_53166/g.156608 Transcript_53166/m.156608 type:complete len:315 (-) Transcript_53166:24-968(-)